MNEIYAPVSLKLHNKQAMALRSRATEILYGGAAGGGELPPLE